MKETSIPQSMRLARKTKGKSFIDKDPLHLITPSPSSMAKAYTLRQRRAVCRLNCYQVQKENQNMNEIFLSHLQYLES